MKILQTRVQLRNGRELVVFTGVAVRRCLVLVGVGQSQSCSDGSHEDGAADQDHCASGVEHLPSIQGLHRPEGPHHRLSTMELEI